MQKDVLGDFLGEFLGTFIMVLFGCGALAADVLLGAHIHLLLIALIWGGAVMLAIYMSRNLSGAHFNPAVTLAMVVSGRMPARKLPAYLTGQLTGAFTAALLIYLLYSPTIAAFEASSGIVRGSLESMATAKIFGCYYSLPGGGATVTMPVAAAAEGFGTFLLVLGIFFLTENCNLGRPHGDISPVFIGLTVVSVICLTAPLSSASLNPARDFSPRVVALLFGWGASAFPDASGGFIWVYILPPLVGGVLAALLFTRVFEPLMKSRQPCCR